MNEGILYFPLNVHLGNKFELIEAEFGLTGFAVIVKLFQRIYGERGYYCEWTNDVALLFSKSIGLGYNVVSEILSASIKRGIFDKDIFDKYHVLTSKGIQERYFEAVSRRKNIEVKKEYLLINVTQNFKNVDILSENVNILSENADIFTQKKRKEKKRNKRKAEESTETAAALQRIIDVYQNNIAPITPIVADDISDWLTKVDEDVITYAVNEAVSYNKRNWKYINAIIDNHFRAGRTTLAAVKGDTRKTQAVYADTGGIDYDNLDELMKGRYSR